MGMDCWGRRRAYSQRSTGASSTASASPGVGTPPAELDSLVVPRTPTKLNPTNTGGSAPNTSRQSCRPTVTDEPGEAWSAPADSNVTGSDAPRTRPSTFHPSLPAPAPSDSRNASRCPHDAHRYATSVPASSYPVMAVVSRPQAPQYTRYG